MLTAEYDYNLDIEVQREEAREEGREQGEEFKLITQIIKKLKKGKPIDRIAEDLEENPEVIEKICAAAEKFAPDYDLEKIYRELSN